MATPPDSPTPSTSDPQREKLLKKFGLSSRPRVVPLGPKPRPGLMSDEQRAELIRRLEKASQDERLAEPFREEAARGVRGLRKVQEMLDRKRQPPPPA